MVLIDYIRLAFFVFIAVGLVIIALSPRRKDEENYERQIGYLDKAYRESRDKQGLPSDDNTNEP